MKTTGATAIIEEINQEIVAAISPFVFLKLNWPKGYLMTRIRSMVIRHIKRTLDSEEIVEIIPAKVQTLPVLQATSCRMYL